MTYPNDNRKNPIVHPLFIAGLMLLLANDFFFKEQYGNWVTGKLSDVAGLFIFPVFWTYLFPKYRKHIHVLTALIFIYWKSSYSQPLIDLLYFAGLHWTRVVDYTDLIALAVLPLSYRYCTQYNAKPSRTVGTSLVLSLSFFAFCSTSSAADFSPMPRHDLQLNRTYRVKMTRARFLAELDTLGLKYTIDSSTATVYHNDALQRRTVRKYVVIKDFVVGQDTIKDIFVITGWWSVHHFRDGNIYLSRPDSMYLSSEIDNVEVSGINLGPKHLSVMAYNPRLIREARQRYKRLIKEHLIEEVRKK